MIHAEAEILMRWFAIYGGQFDNVAVNVRVGPGRDPGAEFDHSIRKMAMDNSKCRIDAVACASNVYTIIEVKQRATSAAIGQVWNYRKLWMADNPTLGEPQLLVICAECSKWVVSQCKALGVNVVVVPVAG